MDTAQAIYGYRPSERDGAPPSKPVHNSSVNNDNVKTVEQITVALRKNVSNWLRWAMRVKPYALGTQPKVAEAAGISQSSVSRILKAKQGVTLEMLAALEKVTGIAAYNLLLPCPDASNPPGDEDRSEGQELMRRLRGAPKEVHSESQHEIAKPGAAGVHRHSQKPALRKKRRSSSRT